MRFPSPHLGPSASLIRLDLSIRLNDSLVLHGRCRHHVTRLSFFNRRSHRGKIHANADTLTLHHRQDARHPGKAKQGTF